MGQRDKSCHVILVVDDDPAIRDSLSKELRAAGYTTMSASDGREGAALFQSHGPDLVLANGDAGSPRGAASALQAAGVPVLALPTASLDQVLAAIRSIGSLAPSCGMRAGCQSSLPSRLTVSRNYSSEVKGQAQRRGGPS